MQPTHSQPPLADARQGMGFLILLINAWADSCLVFLRYRFGSRFRENNAVWAVLLIFVWAGFFAEYDQGYQSMMVFLGLYVFASACHQLMAQWRYFRKISNQEHSRYSGYPRLLKNFPWFSEATIKLKVEPIFVLLVGLMLLLISIPLGLYLIVGSFCLNLSVSLVEIWYRKQAERMHDQMVEQQQLSERFRELREGRF